MIGGICKLHSIEKYNKKKIKANSKIIQIKTNVEDNLTIKQYYPKLLDISSYL